MKQIYIVLLFFLIISCSKEDDCDCTWDEELNQYIPNLLWHEDFSEHGKEMTQERLNALAAECRVDGCK